MEKTTVYVCKHFLIMIITTGNLGTEATEETLRAAFIPFGEIKSIEIPTDHITN